jgi:FKBP-type peptidyl-prolyl cis-trans isomerase FkpA
MSRYIAILILLFLASCYNKEKPKKLEYTTQQLKDLSLQMNSWDEKRQHDEINQYILQHKWDMKMTTSGLRFMLLKTGNGSLAKNGQYAIVAYKIFLLDGTLCYTADKKNPKKLLVGKDNVEAGLHEGIQLMHVGDQMRFILPSHLAHGLTGDQSKIPPLASVVYEVELLELSDNK